MILAHFEIIFDIHFDISLFTISLHLDIMFLCFIYTIHISIKLYLRLIHTHFLFQCNLAYL